MRFQRLDAIMDVLDVAYDEGIKTFKCTTHDRISDVCDRSEITPAVTRASPSTLACHTPTITPMR
jgi:hypothetical protein